MPACRVQPRPNTQTAAPRYPEHTRLMNIHTCKSETRTVTREFPGACAGRTLESRREIPVASRPLRNGVGGLGLTPHMIRTPREPTLRPSAHLAGPHIFDVSWTMLRTYDDSAYYHYLPALQVALARIVALAPLASGRFCHISICVRPHCIAQPRSTCAPTLYSALEHDLFANDTCQGSKRYATHQNHAFNDTKRQHEQRSGAITSSAQTHSAVGRHLPTTEQPVHRKRLSVANLGHPHACCRSHPGACNRTSYLRHTPNISAAHRSVTCPGGRLPSGS